MHSLSDSLLSFDVWLFFIVNDVMSNPFFDWLMPAVSGLPFWIPLYALGLIQLFRHKKWSMITVTVAIGLIIFIADQTSASLIKPWIDRSRPCQSIEGINLLVNCGGGKSFPSAHSTNNFAVATFLFGLFPRKWWLWFSLAFIVAISRVYNGVHYPLDIAGGAAIGAAIGWWMYLLYDWLERRYFSKKKLKPSIT